MPTYVYECRVCGKTFEADQKITEAALIDCDCGAKGGLRRVIQPVAVAFKGAGFHINDYAPKPAAEAIEPEAPSTTPTPTPSPAADASPSPAAATPDKS